MLTSILKNSSSLVLNSTKFIKSSKLNITSTINANRYYSSSNLLRSQFLNNNNNNSSGNNNSNNNNNNNNDNKNKYNIKKIGTGLLAAGIITAGIAISSVSLEEEEKNTSIPVTEDNSTDEEKKLKAKEKTMKEYDIEKFKYVIIGGGTAAYHAVDKILENDKNSEVLIISQEHSVPYKRPPLSKNLWSSEDPNVTKNLQYSDWSGEKMELLYEAESVYGTEALQFIRKKKVIDMHIDQKLILLNDGTLIEFDKCLIATGGEPRKLNFTAKDNEHITTYRTVDDFIKLHDFVSQGDKHVTILGGGFLGSELTCAINQNFGKKKNIKVTQVFPEDGVLPLVFPGYLSEYATEQIKESGVEVINKVFVKDVKESQEKPGKLNVKLSNDKEFETDHVVVAVGIVPNNDVAKSTKLEIDPNNGGIMVNAELQARTDVYVAGDVASFYDYSVSQRRRIEHHDHAKVSGEIAGTNMSSNQKIPYTYQPFYWSDLTPNIGFEAVGNTDSKLKTFSVWEKDDQGNTQNYKKGNIYYLSDKNVVVGVLCFGNYGKMNQAREIIQKAKPVDDLNQLQHSISLEEEHH